MGELFQCPLGLELLQEIPLVVVRTDEVSMPSRAYTSFLLYKRKRRKAYEGCVNALSGLYLISTDGKEVKELVNNLCVNALSGLYLISTIQE